MGMSRKNRKMKSKLRLENVNLSEIRTDTPIVHDELPAAFVTRIAAVFDVVKPYLQGDLSEFLTGFRKDIDPEREIKVWEKIAQTHSMLNVPGLSKAKIFEVLLHISMSGTENLENRMGLSKPQAIAIVVAYRNVSTN